MPRLTIPAAVLGFLLSNAAGAQPRGAVPKEPSAAATVDAAQSKFSLTVYSTADPATFDPSPAGLQGSNAIPGYGVVREIRRIPLVAGDNTVKFSDVAAGIDPTTVAFKSLTAPDSTSVLEQNFAYDLISPDALLDKYVGRSIIVNRKQEPLPNDRTRMPESIEAKLLSFTPAELVLQTNNRQLPVQIIPRNGDITEIKLFELQTGLITKPTLIWRLNTNRAGDHDVAVSYQTDNLTWRADYSVVLGKAEPATADLSAWVTLVNQSGASYPNAKLKLVAGDVQRVTPDRQPRPMAHGGMVKQAEAMQFQERPFFEYHLYTLSRPTSVANNSTKQVELFPLRPNLPSAKLYVYAGGVVEPSRFAHQNAPDRDIRDAGNTKVDVYVQLKNSEQNGLGIPLPAGRVRVYQRDETDIDDPAGSLEFIGEDVIDHTPKDETLAFRLGSAFDVVGKRKQTAFTEDGHVITESFEVRLGNRKKTPVTVVVKETMFRWAQWDVTASSDKFAKHDARTIHIPVEIAPGQENTVTYTVKYTW